MLNAFRTKLGMPASRVDVGTGQFEEKYDTILADAGTLELEFGALSGAVHNAKYIRAAERSEKAIFRASGQHGLLPTALYSATPGFSNRELQVGANADSYYEYLLKRWLQTGKKDNTLKDKWRQAMSEMQDKLVRKTAGGLSYLARLRSGSIVRMMDHLACYVPGMLMLGSRSLPADEVDVRWEPLAATLTETCYQMYRRTRSGLAPESVEFDDEAAAGEDMVFPSGGWSAQNLFRPEFAESAFYMHYYTGDPKYRHMAREVFSSIQKHSKAEFGYALVTDVQEAPVHRQDGGTPSWFFAETLKYLYLTFAPRGTLSLERWVLNMEAHPLKIDT